MATAHMNEATVDRRAEGVREAVRYESWTSWPVNWAAIWVGALAALAAALVFGLAGIALGAHLLGSEHRIVDWHKFSIGALAFSVLGAFLAFVIGGWVAGRIAGILHAEPAMLHGGIVWLVAVPLLLALVAAGAGGLFGGWYAGLGPAPAAPFERPDAPLAGASPEEAARYQAALEEYRTNLKQWKEDSPKATRNAALGSITALLLGLMGAVIGGWMACGEPMTFTHYRTRVSRVPTHS